MLFWKKFWPNILCLVLTELKHTTFALVTSRYKKEGKKKLFDIVKQSLHKRIQFSLQYNEIVNGVFILLPDERDDQTASH